MSSLTFEQTKDRAGKRAWYVFRESTLSKVAHSEGTRSELVPLGRVEWQARDYVLVVFRDRTALTTADMSEIRGFINAASEGQP